MRLHASLTNQRAALRALDYFPRGLRNKWLRISLSAAGGILRDAASRYVRVRTRLLKRSLGVKVKVPAGWNAYVLVGARRGMKRPVVRGKGGRLRAITDKRAAKLRTKGAAVNRYQNPTRYAHLVEKTHPFLQTAWLTAYPAALAKATAKLQEGVASEGHKCYRIMAAG